MYEPEPDGSAWNVSIPAIPSCNTYGRSLAEARRAIRECLSLFEEALGPNAAEIAREAEFDEDVRLPRKLRAAVQRFHSAREKAADLRDAQCDAARAVAAELSLRDAGELLGLSHQGVKKLLETG